MYEGIGIFQIFKAVAFRYWNFNFSLVSSQFGFVSNIFGDNSNGAENRAETNIPNGLCFCFFWNKKLFIFMT